MSLGRDQAVKEFGRVVRRHRELTPMIGRYTLAREAGIKKSVVSGVEHGEADAYHHEQLVRIVNVLHEVFKRMSKKEVSKAHQLIFIFLSQNRGQDRCICQRRFPPRSRRIRF